MDALAQRVAGIFVQAMDEAIDARSHCYCAFSRPTPEEVFRVVGQRAIPRKRVDIYQVDERAAKSDSNDRNYKLIKEHLGTWLEVVESHPMPLSDENIDERKYNKLLEKELGDPPVFDFLHLGLGPDGHTASLVPGDPVLDVDDKWVATTKKVANFRRLTLTYPVVNAARLIIFVVAGREKAEALRGVLTGDESMPAARITNEHVRFYVDADAASLL